MERRVLWTLLIALLLVYVGACRTAPIYNVTDASYAPSSSASQEDMSRAIMRAGSSLGWEIQKVGPGQMKGTINVRSHVAVVDITYDMRSFSIEYVSSQNLLHSGDQIHRNYNRWIANLEKTIRREVASI
jgi:hypothetical protein